MRSLLQVAVFAVLHCVTGEAWADGSIGLRCEVSGKAAADLCDALRSELDKRPAIRDTATLVLVADMPRPDMLTARLDILRDGSRSAGETSILSVIDRATLPSGQLDRLARSLLERSGLISHDTFYRSVP